MSYILEALKQSEYARQQGKALPLNPLPPMIQPPVEPPAHRVLPYPLLAGTLLALAIALAWWRPWPAPAVQQQSPAISPVPPAPAAQPAPMTVTAPRTEPAAAQPAAAPPISLICPPARPTGC